MSVSVAVMNAKGGVGKSTTTMMLAEALCALHGAKTLVIDSDPQASASLMLVGSERLEELQEDRRTLPDVLAAETATEMDRRLHAALQFEVSDVKDLKNLALLPSNMPLAWIDRNYVKTISIPCQHPDCPSREPAEVSGKAGMDRPTSAVRSTASAPKSAIPEPSEALGNSARKSNGVGVSEQIATLIERIRNRFDYVLIDCPPSISVLTESWLAQADFYLAPAKPDYLSVVGLGLLGRLKTEASLRGETFASNLGTVITMRRSNNKTDEHWARKLMREAPFRCFPTEISLAVDIARAGEYAPEKRTLAAKYPSPLTGKLGDIAGEFVKRIGAGAKK